MYIDPSGVVRDTFGYPVVGATVTLSRSVNSGGPFAVVPAGSAIMSPGNRANPDLTIAGGTFGWDVIAGFYRVRAEKSGCTAPGGGAPFVETGVLPIPPPVIDLALTLYCPVTPADLLALIGSLGLERGLASDLTNKTQDAARRMATGKDPCKPLDELVRRVMDEVGKERPKLTTAQARALLHDTYAVEFTDGCRPIGSMLPAAETAVVDLIDVINGLGLPRELATDLRAKASDAGKAAATGVGDPCRKLDEILHTAGRQLTAAQIPAITAAVGEVRVAIGC